MLVDINLLRDVAVKLNTVTTCIVDYEFAIIATVEIPSVPIVRCTKVIIIINRTTYVIHYYEFIVLGKVHKTVNVARCLFVGVGHVVHRILHAVDFNDDTFVLLYDSQFVFYKIKVKVVRTVTENFNVSVTLPRYRPIGIKKRWIITNILVS